LEFILSYPINCVKKRLINQMMLAMYAARALSAGKTLHHYVELLLPDQHTTIGGAAGGGGKVIGCGKLIGDFPLPNGTTSRIKLEDVYYAPTLSGSVCSRIINSL
jgi:hypothetical protein